MSDQLAHSILADVEVLETILDRRGRAAHEAAVRRASAIKNDAIAHLLRTETAPAHIRDRVALIRELVVAGELEQAASANRALHIRLEYIAHAVRAPVLEFASKQLSGLAERRDAHNSVRAAESTIKASAWQREAERIWSTNPVLTKNAVARHVKAKLDAHESSDWIARQLKKPRTAS